MSEVVERILDFLGEVGIPVERRSLPEDTLLPAMTIEGGRLVYDPARLRWPGDLLHEAGHIAVTEPSLRTALADVPDDPGEEMAAIAWSYAAALAAGVDPAEVLHEQGYRGGGGWLVGVFEAGGGPGVPLLQWFGMTLDERAAQAAGAPAYPHMLRWLR